MRLGGPAGEYVEAADTPATIDAVRESDTSGQPVLILGGGSNLVVSDAGFDGRVVRITSQDIETNGELLTLDAGIDWDAAVHESLNEGLSGLETLSGVPGSAGGTPIQNVGAYGSLTSDVLESVTAYDRILRTTVQIAARDCGFGSHRQSIFKHSDRYVILRITLRLRRDRLSAPIAYESLAVHLGAEVGDRIPTDEVRKAVLDLRAQRGMVLDASDHDTWSVGSFFINPVLPAVPESARNCPTYPDPLGIKLPAAWLIQHAGFPPGYGRDWGPKTVALSTKHALAVTNLGSATTLEVMRFAAHIRAGVEEAFGVWLGPECDLVNCSFDD